MRSWPLSAVAVRPQTSQRPRGVPARLKCDLGMMSEASEGGHPVPHSDQRVLVIANLCVAAQDAAGPDLADRRLHILTPSKLMSAAPLAICTARKMARQRPLFAHSQRRHIRLGFILQRNGREKEQRKVFELLANAICDLYNRIYVCQTPGK